MSAVLTFRNAKTGEGAPNETPPSHLNSMSSREFLPDSSSFHANKCKYDVFLSFRGEDTRRNFTDHLYAALMRKGINTFRDDKKLERGESITAEISKAIQESRSSLVVFSRNYAFSSWCLEELVQILECKHRREHQIFPIFYDIGPSTVRKQTGSFRKAFDKHKWAFWQDKRKLQKRRSALVEVANISGWNAKDRLESELIEEVVQKIAVKLRPTVSSYNSVLGFAEIDRCLGMLSSYVASTMFLHSKYGCKDLEELSAEVGSNSVLEQATSFCSSEDNNDSIEQRYQRVELHVRRLQSSLLKRYPLQTLLRATDHFSHSLIVGEESFGVVYRGTLEDNSTVAIKRARVQGKFKDQEFLQEVELLTFLNHRNIARLLGFYVDRAERILVYEFLEHGSLFDHLFMAPNSHLMTSWTGRLKAALESARGIEYLHEYAVPTVIHRDVKSSNILFDSRWRAKVVDLGLSVVAPQSGEADCDVCGTPTYLDPEYYRRGRVTPKSDVYGFGVVLLELLSGQKALCRPCKDEEARAVVDLVVTHIINGKIQEVLDTRVTQPTPSEMEALHSVGELAVDCVNPEGRLRPSMSEIVYCLLKALNPIL